MALATHLSAVEASAAFIHFFEGFRVSHQFESFVPISDAEIAGLVNHEKLSQWRTHGIVDPNNPQAFGCGMGPEMYYPAYEG